MAWEAPIRKLLIISAAAFAAFALNSASAQPVPATTPAPGAAAPQAQPADAAPAESEAQQDAAPTNVVVDQGFALGIGDAVVVGVIGRNDFNTRARVSADGMILLPLLGEVKAVNLTTSELATIVQTRLAKGGFYANPVVRIEVIGVASRYATVLGQVARPGLMTLDRTYHLSDVVARVGARAGDSSAYVVLTRADGTSKKYSMEDLATGAGGSDPIIMSGDKIYVPAATSDVFYISGQVRSPGPFPIIKEITVREAIARGGGLTEMGSDKKIKIYRKNVLVEHVKLDTKIEAGDIIEIGERLF